MNRSRNGHCAAVPIRVGASEFIRVWQTSNSVAEVAMKTRSKKNAVRVRACRYRKLGIPLKEFPVVEVELHDWDELAKYAASLLPGQADADEEGDECDDGTDAESDCELAAPPDPDS